MTLQDVLVAGIALVSAIYLVRSWISRKARSAGCGSCPAVKALRTASSPRPADSSLPSEPASLSAHGAPRR